MKTALILISIYLLSTFLAYKYMQIAHGDKGRWRYCDIETPDLVLTFLPGLNSLFIIIAWIFFCPYKRAAINYNSFFKVKK